MIGHAATMSGNTLGGWIGDTYGIRMAFIVGAVISASMMIPAFFLTSDSMDPVTARLAADAEEKRRALGFAPEGGEVDGDGNPVKLVVIKSPLEAGGGAGDDARRARVKELMVAGGDATDAAAALNEARVLAAVRAHAHGVK